MNEESSAVSHEPSSEETIPAESREQSGPKLTYPSVTVDEKEERIDFDWEVELMTGEEGRQLGLQQARAILNLLRSRPRKEMSDDGHLEQSSS
jgi:hypothetical protein